MATAKTLAAAIKTTSEADMILVQIYAGKEQLFHSKEKTIQLFTVLLHGKHYESAVLTLAGSAKKKQNQSALVALDLLRRYLQPVLTMQRNS